MKNIIVQKFGGTSVATPDKIKNVAQVILKEKNKGNSVVVIVSAMGHTTDQLLKLAGEITTSPSSNGCLKTSSTFLGNSTISSKNNTPL